MHPSMRFFFTLVTGLLVVAVARADESRRLFDFTPVSASNPVVATIDHSIEIPLSELRGYRDAERPHAITDPTSVAQKRGILDELITEYLLIDEAYRRGVPTLPVFVSRMEATRTMLLTDFMSMRAISAAKAAAAESPSPAGNPVAAADAAAAAMADHLFEVTDIQISNEAFAVLKTAAREIDRTREASRRGPVADSRDVAEAKLRDIVSRSPDAVLARYENKSISVRQVLVIYAGMAEPRPNLQTQDGVVQMIKPLITPELMAIQATKDGIATDPAFQAKLTQNRNTLLRFYMQGLIEKEANERLQAPDLEAQLHAWYTAHTAEYAVPGEKGATHVPPFAEIRPRVEADYSVGVIEQAKAEKATALRKLRPITIDEQVLNAL